MLKHSQKIKKVLLLHKYNQQAAAYRYRFSQYFPKLQAAGLEVVSQSLLDDDYLKNKFKRKSNFFAIFKAYIQRIIFIKKNLAQFDVVVLYMEAFPYLPFFFEY